MTKYARRTALVVGEATGIGLAVAKRLVEGGARVVLTAPAPCPDAVRDLAAELASRGVGVNAVAPGCTEAPGAGAVPLPPLGRLGATEEVARAALFLARRRRSPRGSGSPSTAASVVRNPPARP
ncbi:SDR family oxidoreductase [Streptomyces arboris]|uniref:SDR family oxidoreductase n=1 Tax=Streptomyces arboris TaxID=2600619 RepID=UPI001CEF8E20|nr:SDR family oxidoreductase [Streptomyces arboris]